MGLELIEQRDQLAHCDDDWRAAYRTRTVARRPGASLV
jgi:hypothetical protein